MPNPEDLAVDANTLIARLTQRNGVLQQTIDVQQLQIEGLVTKLDAERAKSADAAPSEPGEAPRRKRRTKAEMQAARAQERPAVIEGGQPDAREAGA